MWSAPTRANDLIVVSVDGASNAEMTEASTVVFGGLGGRGTERDCSLTSGLLTCNSCALGATWGLCNPRMVSGSTLLKLSVHAQASGRIYLINGRSEVVLSGPIVRPNDTSTLQISWGEICATMGLNPFNCSNYDPLIYNSGMRFYLSLDENLDGELTPAELKYPVDVMVIDPDPLFTQEVDAIEDCTTNSNYKVGICDLQLSAGDQKITIDHIEATVGMPFSEFGYIERVRIWLSTLPYDQPKSYTHLSYHDFKFTSNWAGDLILHSQTIEGLSNHQTYYARASVVDEANNTYHFTSDEALIRLCGSLNPPADEPAECTFLATPRPPGPSK